VALVLLKVFDDPGAAQVARTTLAAYGIPVFLFEDHNPYPAFPMIPLRLMVTEDDLEIAAGLIEV